METICIYAKQPSQRKELRFLVEQFPKITRVIGEHGDVEQCAEWLKNNPVDSIVAVMPRDIVDRKQFAEFLKGKFPSARLNIFYTVELEELYDFYLFLDGIKKGTNKRDRPIPVRFPKFSAQPFYD